MAKTAEQYLEWFAAVLPSLRDRIETTRRTVERTHRRLGGKIPSG